MTNSPNTFFSGPVGATQAPAQETIAPNTQAPAQSAMPPNALSGPSEVIRQVTNQQPIVDLDLDEIPETTFTDYSFRINGISYTLHLEDDHLLNELTEFSQDYSLDDLHRHFIRNTYMSAVGPNGQPISDGLERLEHDLFGKNGEGKHFMSLAKRNNFIEGVVLHWVDQLNDMSMRSNRKRRKNRR